MPRPTACLLAMMCLAPALAGEAIAQVGFDPEGVFIDASGVLRVKEPDGDGAQRLVEARRRAAQPAAKAGTVYVSLPRLLQAARSATAMKQPIPQDVQTLGGMVRLRHWFVDVENQDLILAGDAEPLDFRIAGRPLGRKTGRPALRFDDLIVALRAFGPGSEAKPVGCTIQLKNDAINRMIAALNEHIDIVKQHPARRDEVSDAMAEAGGMQPVGFHNLAGDTRFAFVCVEADYLLKRLALGIDPTPVRQVPSHLSLKTNPRTLTDRFWFELGHAAIGVSDDDKAYALRGPSLRVGTRGTFTIEGDPKDVSPPARRFADHASKHIEALSQAIPAFADLSNLADLCVFAAALAHDKVDHTLPLDLTWAREQYDVAKTPVPRQVPALVNFQTRPRMVLFSGGGVLFDPNTVVDQRAPWRNVTPPVRPTDSWHAAQP